MTREEIDEVLALIVAGKRTWTSGDPVESLAEIVADQERRLRVLEPCPKARISTHGPHIWDLGGTCEACGIVKGGGR